MIKYCVALITVCLLSVGLLAQAPVITSFFPASGPVGSSLVIQGNNFNTVPADNIVFLGNVRAVVTAASATELTVTVPAGAGYQPLSVTSGSFTGFAPRPFVVSFPGAPASFSNISFTPKTDITAGNQPYFVTAGDLDGDGKPDMVVGLGNIGLGLRLFRNTSTGGGISFAPPVTRSTPHIAYSLALGDMDGDGRLDIIVTDNTVNASVYRNNSTVGTLSFASPVYLSLGSGLAQGIGVGDLDGDGRTDLVIADQDQNKICVFRNNSSGPGNIAFSSVQNFATGAKTFSVAISDLDGDGKPDIGCSNVNSNTFSVLRNTSTTGAISLAARTDFTTGSLPYGLCFADLNGDGLAEAATINNDSYTLSLFKNTSSIGAISFAAKTDYATGASPRCIAAADLDGDGKVDLAAGYDDATFAMSVFKNTSNSTSPTLGAAVNYPVTSYGTYSLALSDFSMDGKPDAAASVWFSGVVSILRNRCNEPKITSFSPAAAGTGEAVMITGNNFTNITEVLFGGVPADSFNVLSSTSIRAVVDTGGASGFVKVISVNGSDSATGFTYRSGPLLNNFAPTSGQPGDTITLRGIRMNLTTSVSFGGTPAASFMIISDTVVKAIVGSGTSGNIRVCGSNTFCSSKPSFTWLPPLTANFVYSPTMNLFAPINIQFTDSSVGPSPIISWLWDFGMGATSTMQNPQYLFTTPGTYTVKLTVSTLTRSAQITKVLQVFPPPPVITSFSPAAGPVGAVVTIKGTGFNTSAGSNIVYFGAVRAQVTTATDTTLSVLAPAGATYQPISVTNKGTGYSTLPFVLTFSGGGSFVAGAFNARIDSAAPGRPLGVALADINIDGKPDVQVTCNDTPRLMLFTNNSTAGTIAMRPRIQLAAGTSVRGIANGDFDGDGLLDVVTALNTHPGPGMIQVRRNQTTGATPVYGAIQSYTLVSYSFPVCVAVGDLNADGKPDIAVADSTDKIYILRNTSSVGSISFAPAVQLQVSFNTMFVAITDLNRDGKPDIVVTTDAFSRLVILRNTTTNGILSFAPNQLTGIIPGPVAVAAGDLNGDGWPDLVTANQWDNTVSILTNTSSSDSIKFAPRIDSSVGNTARFVALGDMDGDSKPDIVTSNIYGNNLSLLRNNGSGGSIAFERRVQYAVGVTPQWLAIGDIDGDGKPDVTVANGGSNTVSFLRSRVGEPASSELCPGSNLKLGASITGAIYQWQVSTDSVNFVNLTDDATYTGTTTDTLRMVNLPSSMYGTVYRCLVNSTVADIFALRFVNRWTGAVSNAWENPANWSCGLLPDGNTDVIINSGSVLLSSNGICRTLFVNTGASFTIAPGFVLTVTH